MDIKKFYKELYSRMKEILIPYGFRKKGDRFRCLLDNGIAWEIERQWDHQKWYNLSAMVNPQVKAQIREGKLPMTYQEPGKEMQTLWIPVQSFEEIIDELCELLEHKVIPLYLSVQSLDGYIDLLAADKGFITSKSVKSARLYADTFGQRFLPMLNKWIKDANNHLEYLSAQDMSKYDECYVQSHERSIETIKERIVALVEIENNCWNENV